MADNLKIQMLIEAVDKLSAPVKKMQETVSKITNKMSESFEKFGKSVKETQKKCKEFGESIKKVGEGFNTKVTLPIIAAYGAMIKFASDMDETLNKVDVSFGKSANSVKKWSETSITKMGLAQQSALDSAALYGDMATGMGMAQNQAATLATSLTQLGADLASFKNVSNDMAQTALKGIFTGETEALKNLGIVMTEVNLEEYAHSQGINKKLSKMTQAEKIMLRYNYVMKQSKNAIGDFERTGGGAANQTRKFGELVKQLGQNFGTYLLPYYTSAIAKLNTMVESFAKLDGSTKKIILIAGTLLAVIGPILTIAGQLVIAIGAVTAPVALAVLGIAALISGFSILWIKSEKFRAVVVAIGSVLGFVGALLLATGRLLFDWIIKPVALAVGWFIKWLTPIGWVVQGLMFLIDKLGGVKKVAEQVTGILNKWSGKIFDFAIKGKVEEKSAGNKGKASTKSMPKHALGTDYAPGGLSLVGENGPELVNLNKGADVHSNRDTKRLLGGSVSVNYNPTINLNGASQSVKEEFSQMLKAHANDIVKIVSVAQRNQLRLEF